MITLIPVDHFLVMTLYAVLVSAFFAFSSCGYEASPHPDSFTPAAPGLIRAMPPFFVHSP